MIMFVQIKYKVYWSSKSLEVIYSQQKHYDIELICPRDELLLNLFSASIH